MRSEAFEYIKERLGPENIKKADRLYDEFVEAGLANYVDKQLIFTVFDSIVHRPPMLERIEAAPSHIRVAITRLMCGGRSTFGLVEYLDVLEKAGYPKVVPLEADLYTMDEFQDALKAASPKNRIYSEVSEEFKTAIRMASSFESRYSDDDEEIDYYMDELDRASLFILRSVYGEQPVAELLTRSVEEKLYQGMTVADLIPILDCWSKLRDLPLTWSRNLTEIKMMTRNDLK